jgi:hypothetical protein
VHPLSALLAYLRTRIDAREIYEIRRWIVLRADVISLATGVDADDVRAAVLSVALPRAARRRHR